MQEKFYIVFLMFASLWLLSNAGDSDEDENPLDLDPTALKPLTYELKFSVNFKDVTDLFICVTTIRLQCIRSTKYIILNVKDITIERKLTKVGRVKILTDLKEEYESLKVVNQLARKQREWHIIELEIELKTDEIVDIMLESTKFIPLKDPDVAFARYSYEKMINGKKKLKWLGVTKSGAVNGRRLYPCVDVVDVKTTFIVEIHHEKIYSSLSNTDMDPQSDPNSTNREAERYLKTSLLSPFSVGFVIGDLKSKEVKDQDSLTYVRIWADEAVVNQMDFACDTTLKIFRFYQSFFRSIHNANKIDLAALPNYGRADKWMYGLMTTDESSIAIQDSSSRIKKINVAFHLCDLFCHQYFGPQTTLSTWSENWINMGFALFFRIPCIEAIFLNNNPSIVNINLVESFIRILAVEAEIKSRPVMLPDKRINLITLFEDSMLAETAYLLVRMMNFFLGQNTLLEGVKNYIRNFRFKVTNLNNLWTLFPLEKEKHEILKIDSTLEDIMDSWTSKAGYAHIKLTRVTDSNMMKIEQVLPLAVNEEVNGYRIIPLNFVTKSELIADSNPKAAVKLWLKSEPVEILVKKDEWIIHDSRLNVLCRVEYDSRSLDLLKKTLLDVVEFKLIPALTRTNFIFDLFALAETKENYYSVVFETMQYLRHENSPLPFIVALHELNKIRVGLFGTEVFPLFQNYVREILQPIFSGKLFSNIAELPQDDYETYHFKKLITIASCTFGLENCVGQAERLFDVWSSKKQPKIDNPIPEILRPNIYCRIIQTNFRDEVWDFFWSLYEKDNPNNFDDILSALACTEDENKLKEYLESSIDASKISPRHSLTVFKSVASNKNGYSLMKNFVIDNFEKILKINIIDRSKVYTYWETLFEMIYNRQDLEMLENSINDTGVKEELIDFETRLRDSRWKAEKNIAWLERNRHDIRKAIDSINDSRGKKRSLES